MSKPTVLITGCTAGSIGYHLALAFASQNHHVFASARAISSMGALSSTPNITLLSLDVTSSASIQSAHDTISKTTGGKLDILYHNAGYRYMAMSLEMPREEVVKTFDVNVAGPVELTRVFQDLLVNAKGKIVFTGSVSGYTPHPSQAVYCASKKALELFAQTLRIEVRPLGVTVVFVVTGGVKTGASSEKPVWAEESRYARLKEKINDAWDQVEEMAIQPNEYARIVVRKIVKNAPDEIWCGGGAWKLWLVERIPGGRSMYDGLFSKMMGLDKALV
jgi:1-acylglycerone phosphate reductase